MSKRCCAHSGARRIVKKKLYASSRSSRRSRGLTRISTFFRHRRRTNKRARSCRRCFCPMGRCILAPYRATASATGASTTRAMCKYQKSLRLPLLKHPPASTARNAHHAHEIERRYASPAQHHAHSRGKHSFLAKFTERLSCRAGDRRRTIMIRPNKRLGQNFLVNRGSLKRSLTRPRSPQPTPCLK